MLTEMNARGQCYEPEKIILRHETIISVKPTRSSETTGKILMIGEKMVKDEIRNHIGKVVVPMITKITKENTELISPSFGRVLRKQAGAPS